MRLRDYKVGDAVIFRFPDTRQWTAGTVRDVRSNVGMRPSVEVLVDNGRPDDPDLDTNGWTVAGWCDHGRQIHLIARGSE